jgi:hypothetical protein
MMVELADRVAEFAGRTYVAPMDFTPQRAPAVREFPDNANFKHGNWGIYFPEEGRYAKALKDQLPGLRCGPVQIYSFYPSGYSLSAIMNEFDKTGKTTKYDALMAAMSGGAKTGKGTAPDNKLLGDHYVVLGEGSDPYLCAGTVLENPLRFPDPDLTNPEFKSVLHSVMEHNKEELKEMHDEELAMHAIFLALRRMRAFTNAATTIMNAAQANQLEQRRVHKVADE